MPPLSAIGSSLVMLLTESVPESCVTVMPARLMTTSSDALGSASVLQLDGVSQSPPLGLIQVTVASSVLSSSWLNSGRKIRRSTEDDLRERRRMGLLLR